MKKLTGKIIIIAALSLSMTLTAFAHSGRTDKNNGHWKNDSNGKRIPNSYHYHYGSDRTIEYQSPPSTYQSEPDIEIEYQPAPEPQIQYVYPEVNINKLGDVLNTDVKTYINGERIPCYNINNKAVILVADLVNYGFDSNYNNDLRRTTITRNYDKKITPIKNIPNNTAQAGTVAFDYLRTDIMAYMVNEWIGGFNIKGNLAIYFESLSDYGIFSWDGATMSSKLTLFSKSEKLIAYKAGSQLQNNTENAEIELSEGAYGVGKDIPEGVYDILWVSGSGGHLFVRNASGDYTVNKLVGDNSEYHIKEYLNADLEIGGSLIISGNIKVKIILKQ